MSEVLRAGIHQLDHAAPEHVAPFGLGRLAGGEVCEAAEGFGGGEAGGLERGFGGGAEGELGGQRVVQGEAGKGFVQGGGGIAGEGEDGAGARPRGGAARRRLASACRIMPRFSGMTSFSRARGMVIQSAGMVCSASGSKP
uniref:hypothetical protein n=1 Tax=Acidocella sp. C78 TaxID=1671486 RepID=UPI0020C02943|nr:hypothetical protein [Acidocella sp. C78]